MNKEATSYKLREQRAVTIGVENGGENGTTAHRTQLNPRQHEPLDGRMGSIHGSQWSSLANPNNGA